MSKYRIIRRGLTNTYLVQKKVLGLFWVTKLGTNFFIYSIDEAKEYIESFKRQEDYTNKLNKPNTIVYED